MSFFSCTFAYDSESEKGRKFVFLLLSSDFYRSESEREIEALEKKINKAFICVNETER